MRCYWEKGLPLAAVVACLLALCATANSMERRGPVKPLKIAVLHVAPNGNDAWGGTRAKPFATLQAARDAARKLGADKPRRRIAVREGQYFLAQPLVLEAQDAGLIIEATRGAKVVLYGGRRVTGW